jgi:ribosome biogenesis GTPase
VDTKDEHILTDDGLVMRVTGGSVWVQAGSALVQCALRGKFRQQARDFQIAAGDTVTISRKRDEDETGVIESVHPRSSWLARFDAAKGSDERVIVANLDTLFIIASVREPEIHHGFIDRVLVSAERGRIKACVCLNKIDLAEGPDEIERNVSIYEACGYRVLPVSALRGDGLADLEHSLTGGIYAFVGESGVGKSSILNTIEPGLNLKTGELMEKSGRGRHTTSFSQLYPIGGGYVADTPGIQTFGYPGSDPVELTECFPEYREYEGSCRFRPCSHSHEPDCAIKCALEEERLQPTRYRSYLSMLEEVRQREKRRYS